MQIEKSNYAFHQDRALINRYRSVVKQAQATIKEPSMADLMKADPPLQQIFNSNTPVARSVEAAIKITEPPPEAV